MPSYFEKAKSALLDFKDAVVYGASIHGEGDATKHATGEAFLVGIATYRFSQNGYYALGAAAADLFLRFEQICYRNVDLSKNKRRKHCHIFDDYMLGLLIGLGVSMAPHNTEVRQADLNKDGYQDMIVKNNRGNLEAFLGQKDGSFVKSEDKYLLEKRE